MLVTNETERPGVSVVVPVYNSEETLDLLVEELNRALSGINRTFEVILVNDGSRDSSWEVITRLVKRYSWVRGICLMRNYGQHNALLCGIRAARYDITVTLDDDLQHPPSEIPKLLAELEKGFDAVYGTPAVEQHGLWRDLASKITKLAMQTAIGIANARHVSAFRAFRTRARRAFSDHTGPYVSVDVVLTWATTRFSAIVVAHNPRVKGISNYTFGKLLIHALNMMTGFSTLPLRLTTFLGFTCTLFGLGVLLYVIIAYFVRGSVVPGFPFLAAVISVYAGVQLFALGIIGEYLARMHFRMMERPTYTVRSFAEPS